MGSRVPEWHSFMGYLGVYLLTLSLGLLDWLDEQT